MINKSKLQNANICEDCGKIMSYNAMKCDDCLNGYDDC